MEQLATFDIQERAKYLVVLPLPVDEGRESSLRDLVAHLEAELPRLWKKLEGVGEAVAKNEVALEAMIRERVDLWENASAQLLHVLRYCGSAKGLVQHFSQEPARIDSHVPRDLREQYANSWKKGRHLAQRDDRTALRARDHLVGLFQKAGREDELRGLEHAASWSARQPNADLMVALSR